MNLIPVLLLSSSLLCFLSILWTLSLHRALKLSLAHVHRNVQGPRFYAQGRHQVRYHVLDPAVGRWISVLLAETNLKRLLGLSARDIHSAFFQVVEDL